MSPPLSLEQVQSPQFFLAITEKKYIHNMAGTCMISDR
jgi:hypothetical protein